MSKSLDRGRRPLVERLLDTADLAQVVPQLQPEVLHRVIQVCGLEACGDLVALATPDQIARVFDLDLWRAVRPGLDEHFDVERFGTWLEVLVDSGPDAAARILADMDPDLVTAGLSQHVRVFDPAARLAPDELHCELGGYLVVARHPDFWDAMTMALVALDAEDHDRFDRIMRGCRRLSNGAFEIDGLDHLLPDREQAMFDLAFSRERRREAQGYATPAQARAFLEMSRRARLGQANVAASPIARAYFRSIDEAGAADPDGGAHRPPAAAGRSTREPSADVAGVMNVLIDEGVLPPPARALLDGGTSEAPRFARLRAQMQFVRDRDDRAWSLRSQELAYLANTIMAGCSIQARPFTAQESSDAAVAACNLGLDCREPVPDDFLVEHDLIGVFQAGWTVLYRDVCLRTAERLIGVVAGLRHRDREIQAGLDALQRALTIHCQAGAPWLARDAVDVVASLDLPSWATLLALLDECPVMHAGIAASEGHLVRAIDATAFEFIESRAQIARVAEFLRALPETLRP